MIIYPTPLLKGRILSPTTVNLRTNIMDFRGFNSNIILILRGGIPVPVENFSESLSQAILVGIILVSRAENPPQYQSQPCYEY